MLFIATLVAMAVPMAYGATLSGDQLRRWISAKPSTVIIHGEELSVDKNSDRIAQYFTQQAPQLDILPKDYLDSIGGSACADDLRRNIYRLNSSDPPVELPEDLSWGEDPYGDPGWQLQFQRWKFADCLMQGYAATEDKWFIDRLKWVPIDWARDSLQVPPPSPSYSWQDHSIPIRMFNAMRIFEFLKRTGHLDAASSRSLLSVIGMHADIIANEKSIYKKSHNHGLDQSFRLLQVAHYFPEFTNAARWRKVALARINHEIDFAMTDEGVHRENTPSYHDGISSYVTRILHDMVAMGEAEPGRAAAMQEQALRFTTVMLRPDSFYPQIGDTPAKRAQVGEYPGVDYKKWAEEFRARTREKGFLWPKSGYYVHRSGWEADASHLVLKCGFLSSVHRHADDSSIVFFAFGEDWLIDAGMYGYGKPGSDESKIRALAVAPESHNLTMPVGAKTLRKPYGSGLSAAGSDISCKTPMFIGYDYERRLSIDTDFSFRIRDTIRSMDGSSAEYRTLFRIPADKSIEIGLQSVSVWNKDRSHRMVIAFPQSITNVRVSSGADGNPASVETVSYRRFKAAKTIVFQYNPASQQSAEFRVSIR